METTDLERWTPDLDLLEPDEPARPPDAAEQMRLNAFILDALLFLPAYRALMWLGSPLGIDYWTDKSLVVALVVYWVGFVAVGITPGSWLTGIRIVDEWKCPPGPWRAFRRSLIPGTVWFLVASYSDAFSRRVDFLFEEHPDAEGGLFLVGFLTFMFSGWICLDEGKRDCPIRQWHDAIAGTQVILHRGRLRIELGRRMGRLANRLETWAVGHTPDWFERLRGERDESDRY
jgi:uncharacterized RDD family membrane protein YckC